MSVLCISDIILFASYLPSSYELSRRSICVNSEMEDSCDKLICFPFPGTRDFKTGDHLRG